MNKKIPKYLKLTFAASILGTSLLTGFPTNTYAEDTLTVLDVNATQNGWSLQDGTWYYYKNGILLTNTWITSGGQYYYLGEDGSMQTNTWIGNYYVDSNGVWLTNYQPAHWVPSGSRCRGFRLSAGRGFPSQPARYLLRRFYTSSWHKMRLYRIPQKIKKLRRTLCAPGNLR